MGGTRGSNLAKIVNLGAQMTERDALEEANKDSMKTITFVDKATVMSE